MLDERRTQETGEETYEPPAIAVLGSAADLTAGSTQDADSVTTTLDSDLQLKSGVELLEGALEQLGAIRIC